MIESSALRWEVVDRMSASIKRRAGLAALAAAVGLWAAASGQAGGASEERQEARRVIVYNKAEM